MMRVFVLAYKRIIIGLQWRTVSFLTVNEDSRSSELSSPLARWGGYHFTHAISSYIAIEQLSAKQATREEVAITQSLFKFREFVQPAYDLAATKAGFQSIHSALYIS